MTIVVTNYHVDYTTSWGRTYEYRDVCSRLQCVFKIAKALLKKVSNYITIDVPTLRKSLISHTKLFVTEKHTGLSR